MSDLITVYEVKISSEVICCLSKEEVIDQIETAMLSLQFTGQAVEIKVSQVEMCESDYWQLEKAE